MKEFCDKENIKIIAYNPFADGLVPRIWNLEHNDEFNVFKEQIFIDLAKKYSKTVGQIILNWHISLGVIPILDIYRIDKFYEYYVSRMREYLLSVKFKMEDKDVEDICNFALNERKMQFLSSKKYFGINIFG